MGPTRLRLAKPVIAAIAGHAMAGGLELALWCDLRVAEEDAVLGVFCRRWGVPLIDGGTVRLPRIVGLGRALDMILTGRAVAAPEALAMGLADRVVPPGQAWPTAEAIAHEIAALPQQCLRSDRASVLEAGWLGEDEAMANEFRHGMTVLTAPGLADGVSRFRGGAGQYERGAILLPWLVGAGSSGSSLRDTIADLMALRLPLSATVQAVLASGDLALVLGEREIAGTGPASERVRLSGLGSSMVRRQPDGTWCIVAEAWCLGERGPRPSPARQPSH
jgi:Enoyl-CoA hydratase/isomerase